MPWGKLLEATVPKTSSSDTALPTTLSSVVETSSSVPRLPWRTPEATSSLQSVLTTTPTTLPGSVATRQARSSSPTPFSTPVATLVRLASTSPAMGRAVSPGLTVLVPTFFLTPRPPSSVVCASTARPSPFRPRVSSRPLLRQSPMPLRQLRASYSLALTPQPPPTPVWVPLLFALCQRGQITRRLVKTLSGW